MRTVRRWLDEAAGGLPGTFWTLWFGTLINRLGNVGILYLQIFLVARYHFSASFAGLVIGLCGAGGAIGSVIGGVLADRLGRRPTLLIANLACAGTTLALGLVTSAAPIAILAATYGLWNGTARPATSALMIDVLDSRQRTRAMNLNYWALNIGFAVAAAMAGVLSDTPRTIVFAIDAASTAAGGLLVFFRVPEVRPPAATASAVPPVGTRAAAGTHAGPTARDGLRTVLTDRIFLTFVALHLAAWTIIATCTLMPITLLHHGLSPATYGPVMAVNGVMIVVGQLFVPRLLRGRSRTRVLALAALLLGIGFGAVAFAPTALLLAGTVVIWTVGEMIAAPSGATLVADLSRPHLRGRYQGVASLSFTASGFFAPIIGGYVIDHVGDAAVWLGCFALGCLVALGHLVTGPARERRATAWNAAQAGTASEPDSVAALATV